MHGPIQSHKTVPLKLACVADRNRKMAKSDYQENEEIYNWFFFFQRLSYEDLGSKIWRIQDKETEYINRTWDCRILAPEGLIKSGGNR